VQGRTTIGLGVLYASVENTQRTERIDVNGFAFTIRQVFFRAVSRSTDLGIKAEQTFSRYDNFFRVGFVFSMRF
jgi:hypothetical protein